VSGRKKKARGRIKTMKKNLLAITFAVAALPLMTFAQANPPASSAAPKSSASTTTSTTNKVKKHSAKKAVKKSTDTSKPAASTGSGK
jgi:hypothetical protein